MSHHHNPVSRSCGQVTSPCWSARWIHRQITKRIKVLSPPALSWSPCLQKKDLPNGAQGRPALVQMGRCIRPRWILLTLQHHRITKGCLLVPHPFPFLSVHFPVWLGSGMFAFTSLSRRELLNDFNKCKGCQPTDAGWIQEGIRKYFDLWPFKLQATD